MEAEFITVREIFIGRSEHGDVRIPLDALLTHLVALGSTGSGKTVLCKSIIEEVALNGVPVIAVDPQGDLASLAIPSEDGSKEFTDNVEVAIFTPASDSGIPICINPLAKVEEDVGRYAAVVSGALCQLIGYDTTKEIGQTVESYLYSLLKDLWSRGERIRDFRKLARIVAEERKESLLTEGERRTLARRIRLLATERRALLFGYGVPLDIDLLRGERRISVIYLNTLPSQAEKSFFVSFLVSSLYDWMLKHPSDELQLLFYIDEVAAYMPPDPYTPPSKRILRTLFKQARKYGIGCMMATQNPADVDYKAFSQFGIWALGKLTTKQDVGKVKLALDSIGCDPDIIRKLPSLSPPSMILFAPGLFGIAEVDVRRLYTRHMTLTDEDVKRIVSPELRELMKQHMISPGEEEIEEDLISEHLQDSIRCFELQDLCDDLNMNRDMVRAAIRDLMQRGLVREERVGRKTYYFWASHGLSPRRGVFGAVLAASPSIGIERAEKIARAEIGILSKEKLVDLRAVNLPFWAISVDYPVDEGLILKRRRYYTKRIYISGTDRKFLAVDKGKLRMCDEIDVEAYEGVDKIAELNKIPPSNLENLVYPSVTSADAMRYVRKKLRVNPRDAELCFIPFWRAEFHDERKGAKRILHFDALTSSKFELI